MFSVEWKTALLTKSSTSFCGHIHCHVTVVSPHSGFGLDHATWLGQWGVTQEESRKSTKASHSFFPVPSP